MPGLKIPIFNKDIDYLDIVSGGNTLLSLTNKDLKNKTWREFQILIGKKLGKGLFNYTMKFKNSDKPDNGKVRAVAMKSDDTIQNKDELSPYLLQKLNDLEKIISNSTNGNDNSVAYDLLRQSYEVRIEGYKEKINDLKQENKELLEEIKDLENEVKQLESNSSDFGQLIQAAKMFTSMKKTPPIRDLSASDSSDIPNEIIEILGLVDYNSISQEQLNEIVNMLRVWIQKFPLKQSG